MNSQDGVSIVICAFNSVDKLDQTLLHLSQQQTDASFSIELILVDNASTDQTATLAQKIWQDLGSNFPLQILREKRQGLSFARNTGINHATFEFILLCDDDNHLDSAYCQNGFRILKDNTDIAALGGKGKVISDVSIPEWFERYKYNYACYSQGNDIIVMDKEIKSLYGAGLFIRKKMYLNLFQSNFKHILSDRKGKSLISGGDTELTYAFKLLGHELAYSSELTFEHFMPKERLTEKYLLKLIKSQAYSASLLRVYDFLFEGTKPRFLHWFKDCLYQSFYFICSLYRYTLKRDTTQIDAKAGVFFSFGKLIGYLSQAGGYRHKYFLLKNNLIRIEQN